MKRSFYLILIFTLVGLKSFAQIYNYSDFAQQTSQNQTFGSTRMMGLGGMHVALGGDLSNISQNPAGLGFYSRSEIGLGFGFQSKTNNVNYIGNSTSSVTNNGQLNFLGLVFGGAEPINNIRSSFGISYSVPNNFNMNYSLNGVNNASSLLDKFVQNANSNNETGASLDSKYDYNSNTANNLTAAAYQAYLLNPDANTAGAPFWRWEEGKSSTQNGAVYNSGKQSQWSFSYGLNFKDKFYWGIGLNFLKLKVENEVDWQEKFNGATNVAGFTSVEKLTTKGTGVNLISGLIIRPNSNFQFGINIQTPSLYDQIYEEYTGSLDPDIISIPTVDDQGNSGEIIQVNPINLTNNQFYYSIITPFKLDLGGVFFIKKKGFISANFGTINYSKTRITTDYLSSNIDNSNFGNGYDEMTRFTYQKVYNYKFGAEYKVMNRLAVRLGYSYLGNPVKKAYDDTDRSISQVSVGLGYRSNKFYWDAAFLSSQTTNIYTPYTLNNSSSYASSVIKINQGMFQMNIGTFF
jgi:hypothetical protein